MPILRTLDPAARPETESIAMTHGDTALDTLAINTIRTLAIDAIERANSGHPGLPLGAAPMAYVLWQNHLRFDPANPCWANRDRFLLSAGHGSMLLYGLLHVYGYDLPLAELRNFRQWESKTPGHPEFGHTAGVEATTGPLGQGSANAVGMAMAEAFLAKQFNRGEHRIVDHFTYALVSDGDLMEGIAAEAASIAGHLGLGKLIYLYDANDVSLDGPLDLCFSENVGQRYEASGWHVQTVADGDRDLDAIDAAIEAAKAETSKPSLIIVKTTIGFGSPNKGGKSSSHGSPLGSDEAAATKAALGWKYPGEFVVPDEARERFEEAVQGGAAESAEWDELFSEYEQGYPELAEAWRRAQAGELPEGWDADLPVFEPGTKAATRSAGGKVQNALAKNIPWLFGGDADLGCSTKTLLSGEDDFDGRTGAGRNIRYGVREHAMGAIANGIAYHGGARTWTATFFVFSDYMRPALRLAAMNRLPVTFVFTHDSIALGEDGPTHQPVEHLASLRAVPDLVVVRPSDPTETVEAWKFALRETRRPVVLVFSRQDLPALDRTALAPASELARGGYVLADAPGAAPELILIATGAEVHLALEAHGELVANGIAARVVALPSWELFAEQPASYRDGVLPPSVTARVSIEAGATFGWERWTGTHGATLGLDRFGASAPAGELMSHFGFTVDRIVETARATLEAGAPTA